MAQTNIFWIFKAIIFFTLPCHVTALFAENHYYTKGVNTFEITETSKEYQVICTRSSNGISSRNKNIADRRLRMEAIDLIGAYILYKNSDIAKRFSSAYFQIYVDGLNLHYDATLEGVRQSEKKIAGKSSICYSCDKDAYKIALASYNSNLDIAYSLASRYQKEKSEESAFLLYNYDGFTVDQYIALERDYLTGKVQLPLGIRQIQETIDRLEFSIISPDENNLSIKYKEAKRSPTQKNPFRQFYYEELITVAPLKDKKVEYENWKRSLDANGCIYESILEFCSTKKRQPIPSEPEATLSSVIEAFPGAISPFGIRRPSNNTSYNAAVEAYSKSDFKEAARILKEAIDTEGATPEMLNLIGASYRFLNQPEKSMPYLLLCFKMAPNTQYLSGNLFLCLKQMGFSKMSYLAIFCKSFAVDSWSKTIFEKEHIQETDDKIESLSRNI